MSVKRGYVGTADGQVHYRGAGVERAGPAVVCFHQSPSSSWVFEEALAVLGETFPVFAPDTPGFGQSFAPETADGVGYYARVLGEALSALGVERFHAIGHHTGASIVARLAVDEPDRLLTTTFVGPPYLTDAERRQRLERFEAGAYDLPPLDADGRYLLGHWEKYADEADDLEVRHRMTLDSLLARGNARQAYRVVWEQDFRTLFDRISVPRMAMAAPDDALWDAFCRLRDEHPSVPTVSLSGGNFEPLLDVEEFTDAVQAFLAE